MHKFSLPVMCEPSHQNNNKYCAISKKFASMGKPPGNACTQTLLRRGCATHQTESSVYLAQLWMIGRLAVRAENASDLAAAQAAQKGFKIEPLFPKTYKKPFAMQARDLYR